MSFQLRPRLYSLLLCRSITQDRDSGGWIVHPFSEISVREMPADLTMAVFAQIMAPPGEYALELRMFHAADPEGSRRVLQPRPFTVQEGKNLDFVLQVQVHVTQLGLYLLEAEIVDHHALQAPLRVSAA